MNSDAPQRRPLIAIACGGTGGHLFPGVAVGEELLGRGCDVMLIVSEKDIDRRAAQGATGMEVVPLPAVGLSRNPIPFLLGLMKSRRTILQTFRARRPKAVLGMGGFTSAAPILAGKAAGAKTFLHESNTIPGRANRWLSRKVDELFVWFPETAARLTSTSAKSVGMPVRGEFRRSDAGDAREALGLDRDCPTLLVMGGSQGAHSVNMAMIEAAPRICTETAGLQILHLTGANDFEKVSSAYSSQGIRAVTRDFLDDMPTALNAATLAVARSGASSMAELAAVGTPSVLIPYPHAADNHQFHNANAFVTATAAQMLGQSDMTAESLAEQVGALLGDHDKLAAMAHNAAKRHEPNAARRIADCIFAATDLCSASEQVERKTSPLKEQPGNRAVELGTVDFGLEDFDHCHRRASQPGSTEIVKGALS